MDFLTPEKISLILYFFVPGYISMNVYRMFFPLDRIDFSKSLYEAVGISLIYFTILFGPIYIINQPEFRASHQLLFYVCTAALILVCPIIFAYIYSRFQKSNYFNNKFVTQEKTTWDIFFAERKSYWVIITLKDGRSLGGRYGMSSIASVYPAPREIYLEDVWHLDGDKVFVKSIDRNRGIIILGEDILTIEFYN